MSIANPVSSHTAPAAAGSTTSTSKSAPSPTDALANESTFLTLLVSQLQNQDPLNPVDSNQFVSQLTQYSQLEQLIGIHSDTTTLSTAVTAGTTPPSSTNSNTGATN
jgi:flagellar basal-body rod modification protein FlgD